MGLLTMLVHLIYGMTANFLQKGLKISQGTQFHLKAGALNILT